MVSVEVSQVAAPVCDHSPEVSTWRSEGCGFESNHCQKRQMDIRRTLAKKVPLWSSRISMEDDGCKSWTRPVEKRSIMVMIYYNMSYEGKEHATQ